MTVILGCRAHNSFWIRLDGWEILESELVLVFGHHNCCRVHTNLLVAPAMKARLVSSEWIMEDSLVAECS